MNTNDHASDTNDDMAWRRAAEKLGTDVETLGALLSDHADLWDEQRQCLTAGGETVVRAQLAVTAVVTDDKFRFGIDVKIYPADSADCIDRERWDGMHIDNVELSAHDLGCAVGDAYRIEYVVLTPDGGETVIADREVTAR